MTRRSILFTLPLSGALFLASTADMRGQQLQYMAVCTETQEHGGNEYSLTSWLDSFGAANAAGKAHEQATHGHRWRVVTRNKP